MTKESFVKTLIIVSILCTLAGCAGNRNEPRDIPDPDTTSATDDLGGVIGCAIVIATDSPRGDC
ncbi:hypothetical protein BIY22_07280 [Vibrio panuliri]|uniref:Uncharacterized protein n=1 Tax=Vibrio panuliri TaxID=1381081 RepID=A0A1Q9HE19_9VIBR|nr:hypothetical protein BIY22_07280 [Vibrio panuliri]OLQ95231.1 hypothetical protein BIY20_06665 [Vibrio panuliri]